jgi:hypothetical protein
VRAGGRSSPHSTPYRGSPVPVTTKYGSRGFSGWQHESVRRPQKLVENSRFDHQWLILVGGRRDFGAVAARSAVESECCGAADGEQNKKLHRRARRESRHGAARQTLNSVLCALCGGRSCFTDLARPRARTAAPSSAAHARPSRRSPSG